MAIVTGEPPSSRSERAYPREGFVQVPGGPVWYRIFGSGDRTPLLIVHGGPGGRSCILEPFFRQF